MSIFRVLRHLILGFVLIFAAGSILLISDWSQRRAGGPLKRVALLQHASQASLDEAVGGYLDALADRGFVNGKTISTSEVPTHRTTSPLPMRSPGRS